MDKKLDNFPFLKLILKVLNKLIQILGSIFLLIIILLVFHYYSSGMYVKYKPVTLFKKIDKIILK